MKCQTLSLMFLCTKENKTRWELTCQCLIYCCFMTTGSTFRRVCSKRCYWGSMIVCSMIWIGISQWVHSRDSEVMRSPSNLPEVRDMKWWSQHHCWMAQWELITADVCVTIMAGVIWSGHSRLLLQIHWTMETKQNNDSGCCQAVKRLCSLQCRFGVPDVMVSDNGPQVLSQEFPAFTAQLMFRHMTSSPHYPQLTGEVERAVQTAKSILPQDDISLALMHIVLHVLHLQDTVCPFVDRTADSHDTSNPDSKPAARMAFAQCSKP